MRSLATRHNKKLNLHYYHLEVLERIGARTYQLDLPPYVQIHPIFHISQLKKVIGTNQDTILLPL